MSQKNKKQSKLGVYFFLKENAIAIASFFIALMSLFLTAFQIDRADKNTRLSVVPVINFTSIGPNEFSNPFFAIENKGLGPAILKGVNIKIDNKNFEFKNDFPWAEIISYFYVKYNLKASNNIKFHTASLNMILAKNELAKLIEVVSSNVTTDDRDFIRFVVNKMELGVCYNSLYQDNFYVEMKTRYNFKYNFKYHCFDKYTYKIWGNRIQFKLPWNQKITWRDIHGN